MSRRVAFVTGSARGIGRAIVDALAPTHDVIGVDVLAAEADAPGRHLRADLSDPAECARLVDHVGQVDVLVNNAAILIHKPIPEFTLEDFDRTLAVNLRAPFLLSQALVPRMAERGWGRMVTVSSVGARTGGVSQSCVYNATKAALISMTKNFARNYGPSGVTANAVAPGAVDTAMTAHISADEHDSYQAQIPLRRFSEPTEVAAVVAFLASDAASYVTGATVDVNGGWLMT